MYKKVHVDGLLNLQACFGLEITCISNLSFMVFILGKNSFFQFIILYSPLPSLFSFKSLLYFMAFIVVRDLYSLLWCLLSFMVFILVCDLYSLLWCLFSVMVFILVYNVYSRSWFLFFCVAFGFAYGSVHIFDLCLWLVSSFMIFLLVCRLPLGDFTHHMDNVPTNTFKRGSCYFRIH